MLSFLTDRGFFRLRADLFPAMIASPIIQFYTKEFFEELARRLNEDEDWLKWGQDLNVRIVCSAVDIGRAFLIAVKAGEVRTSEVFDEMPAKFKLQGKYENWVKLCKGEAELDKLIRTGRIRLTGSMPDLMGMAGPLNRIVMVARSFPKTF